METTILYPTSNELDRDGDQTRLSPFSLYNSDTLRQRAVWCVVAMGRDRSIGRQGGIPWHIREDLKRFKALTLGHPVIMGRKTWESLPKRPLPGRRNIVVTRNEAYQAPGAETAPSVEAAVAMCRPAEEPVIIGGEQVYRQALPYCTRLYVTAVDTEVPDADAFFPGLSPEEWVRVEETEPQATPDGIGFSYVTYTRK